jgi:hypothetical protein
VAQARTFPLMGSGEFELWSAEIERAALDGRTGPVAVLPTASSTDGDTMFDRCGRMGLHHYASMAVGPHLAGELARGRRGRVNARALAAAMIFFSGGKPQHLASTILGTKLWNAMQVALDRGTSTRRSWGTGSSGACSGVGSVTVTQARRTCTGPGTRSRARTRRPDPPISWSHVGSIEDSTSERIVLEHQPRCFLCGRATYDPDKRERPWARATSGGHQVLVCPSCQEERPDWAVQLDRCENCGATRLTAVLGQVVCRACGHVRGESVEPAWMKGA